MLKGVEYSIQEVEDMIFSLAQHGFWRRICLSMKYKKQLKNLKDLRTTLEAYSNGRCNGEITGLKVLDPGLSVANGVSIAWHVPDFRVWQEERFDPQFPRSVEMAIEIQAVSWAHGFIESGGRRSLEDLIIDMHKAALIAVQPIASKGYLAWHIYEKGFGEDAIFNEITNLFASSGNAVYTLLGGLPLWHVGLIDDSLKVRYGRPLWTTDKYSKNGNYLRQSTQDTNEARRIHLNLVSHTLVADFYKINLQPMQARFGLSHPELSYFIKEWGLKHNLGGLTGTNGAWDEVVLFKPEHQLKAFLVENLVSKQVTHFNPAKGLSI